MSWRRKPDSPAYWDPGIYTCDECGVEADEVIEKVLGGVPILNEPPGWTIAYATSEGENARGAHVCSAACQAKREAR